MPALVMLIVQTRVPSGSIWTDFTRNEHEGLWRGRLTRIERDRGAAPLSWLEICRTHLYVHAWRKREAANIAYLYRRHRGDLRLFCHGKNRRETPNNRTPTCF